MKRITPFLWFESEAEAAARYYVSIFPGAKLGEIARFPAGGRGVEGGVMAVTFELDGEPIVTLNGNEKHSFSPASSLFYNCDSSEQAEQIAEKLAAGGERQFGGWLVDKFGVSWQIAAR